MAKRTILDLSAGIRRAAHTIATAHDDALAKGAKCKDCPFYKRQRGPVKSELRPGTKLVVIGEAPDSDAVAEARIFTSSAGVELEQGLVDGGLQREDVSITQLIACQPEIEGGGLNDYLTWFKRENAAREERKEKPLMSPVEACRPRLLHDLIEAASDTWLTVGSRSLEFAAHAHGLRYGKGKDQVGEITIATIKNQHGAPIELPPEIVAKSDVPAAKRTILPSLHPSFARKGKRSYRPIIRADIARAAQIAQRGIDWSVPEAIHIYPPIELVEQICRRFVETEAQVAVDIESDSIDVATCQVRCVGIGGVINGEECVIVVPLRWMDSREYWPNARIRKRAEAAICAVMDRCSLIMHNGAYDSAVLLRTGMMTDRDKRWDCTMIGHHDTDHNDLPHSLGFVATRFFESPMWKQDVDHKASDNVAKDRDLHEYNAMDVLLTLRAWDRIEARIESCGTRFQYQTDQKLAPVAREMKRIGVYVDEAARGKLSEKLNTVCHRLRKRVNQKAGRALNPRSSQQVAKWLFDDLGIMPPLNPQGYEWREGDGYSTSAEAITRILEKETQLPVNVREALQALLEFKSAEKLRSTYVDGVDSKSVDWPGVPRAPAVRVTVFDKKGLEVEAEVLPERAGLSQINPTWGIHSIPTGRWSSSPNCFDSKTEILTRLGWKPVKDVTVHDQVAQYVKETGRVEWMKPINVTRRSYTGAMVHIRNQSIDVRVTADHRLLRQTRSGRFETFFAGDPWIDDRKWFHAGECHEGQQTVSEERLIVLVAVQADAEEVGNDWRFHFVRQQKVTRLERALQTLGVHYQTKFVQHRQHWELCIRRDAVDLSFGLDRDKTFSWKLLDLCQDALVFLRAELYHWGGCFTSSVRKDADIVQAIHALTGQRANIRKYQPKHSPHPNWQVDRTRNRHSMTTNVKPIIENVVNEEVYCLSVPSDLVVVRRGGRVSITHQCQNWPARAWGGLNLRRLVIAPPGHVFVGADYEQIELRLYALQAGDQILLKAFHEGLDAHSLNTATLFAPDTSSEAAIMEFYWDFMKRLKYRGDDSELKAEAKRCKHVRNITKRVAFLETYGGEAGKLFSALSSSRDKATGRLDFPGVTLADCMRWHERWHELHPETRQWHERCARMERQLGYVAAMIDYRKRYFLGGPDKKNAVPNHTIQGSSAAIMNRGILALAEAIPFESWSPQTGLCLQVHDYAAVCVPEDRAEETIGIVRECLECTENGMPFPVDTPLATKSWADQ